MTICGGCWTFIVAPGDARRARWSCETAAVTAAQGSGTRARSSSFHLGAKPCWPPSAAFASVCLLYHLRTSSALQLL
jgi:hypothetical protein